MQIRISQETPSTTHTFFVFKGGNLDQVGATLSYAEQKAFTASLRSPDTLGEHGRVESAVLCLGEEPVHILCIGLGDAAKLQPEDLRKASAKSVQEWERMQCKTAAVYPPAAGVSDIHAWIKVFSEAAVLTAYRFDKYRSKSKPCPIEAVDVICSESDIAKTQEALAEGLTLAESTNIARDLVHEPANVMSPTRLGQIAIETGESAGFAVEVFGEDEIAAFGMEAFLEVTRAAKTPAKLIVMRYRGAQDNADILGLVGKGITYDSGGLSLKAGDSLSGMHRDMGGAAAVIGAIAAIARQQLRINVVAVIAACENVIDGDGYRPGDIIQTMAGKTVFVASTDAEGRLTLADAIHYAIEKEGAARIVDIATLTGAASIALGSAATAVLTNNQTLYSLLEQASELSGERVWQLPSFPEYKELIKAKDADLTNTGGKSAGTIAGGLFVGEFVQDKPWLHLDIAGTASATNAYTPRGGSGRGVRLLYHLADALSDSGSN